MVRTLVLVAAVAALAAPVFAQPPAATPEEREARFVAADKNKDGKLDKAEFTSVLPAQAQANVDQIWPRADADGDGFVTKEQFLALRQGPRPGGN